MNWHALHMNKVIPALFLIVGAVAVSGFAAAEPPADFNRRYAEMDRSVEGLTAYRESIRSLHEQAKRLRADSVHTTITLAEPVSAASAVELLESYEVEPRLIYAHALSGGQLITIAGTFPEQLEEELALIAATEKADLLGVVAVIGAVRTEQLDALQSDQRVFLADISADRLFASNPGNMEYMQHFAWDLYEQRQKERDRDVRRPLKQ